MLEEEGLENVFARHHRLAEGIRRAVAAWGLKLCAQSPDLYSETVSAIFVREGFDSTKLVVHAADKYGVAFGVGLGEVAGKVFRIGHLGSLTDVMALSGIACAEMVMADLDLPIKLGSGVAAAQEYYRGTAAPALKSRRVEEGRMDIHEYQAKEMLARFGVPVPRGGLAYSPEQAAYRAREIGGHGWVVKAQIHSGGRGKAGGVKLCRDEHEVEAAADELLGRTLVTEQTGPARQGRLSPLCRGRRRRSQRELYLGFVLDRKSERVMVVASSAGGMEIEEIAHEQPETPDPRRRSSPPSACRRSRRASSPSRSGWRPGRCAGGRHAARLLPRLPRARRHHGRDQPADRDRGGRRCWRSTPR